MPRTVCRFFKLMCFTALLTDAKVPLYIGGFMPFSDVTYDKLVTSVHRAIEDINSFEDILSDYELTMIWNWTMAEPAPGLKLLYDFVYNKPPIVMAWGPIYSKVGEVVNEVAKEYNLVQVCIAQFQSNDEHLQRYPYTVQIYPNSNVFTPARTKLIQLFGWTRVAIIYQNVDLFRREMEEMVVAMRQEGIQLLAVEYVDQDPHDQVANLKQHDARIIIGLFYQDIMTKVLCEAYSQGYYGDKYVWMLVGWYHAQWWVEETHLAERRGEKTCTSEQVGLLVDGSISMRGFEVQKDMSKINFNGVYPTDEQIEFYRHLQSQLVTGGACDSYGYDQIVTMALALNSSIEKVEKLNPPRKLHEFTYSDAEMARIFREQAGKTTFVGLTGEVVFDSYGSRFSNAVIQQMQDWKKEEICVYDRDMKSFRWINEFQWPGGRTPVDGPTYINIPVVIETVSRIVMFSLASVGILVATVFLVLNIAWRDRRVIKISCPPLNNVIAVGCMLLYSSTFLFGIDLSLLGDGTVGYICQLELFVVCTSISLAFGGLFMKTYRIHAIFSASMKKVRKVRGVTNGRLLGVIGAFVVIDVITLVVWHVIDPIYKTVTYLDAKFDEQEYWKEIWRVPEVTLCTSDRHFHFTTAIYVYKGCILLFGVFLAWETRNVAVTELNDSKYIAMSVYTVGISCIVAVPVMYIWYEDTNFMFVFISSIVIVTASVILSLVFVPKFVLAHKYPDRVISTLSAYSCTDTRSQLSTSAV
ncbi:gamma-aminobutyric acid type B receptor subunit 2-like [Saccoglossus kowalevskii]